MKYIKLFEDLQDKNLVFEEIQKMIDANQFLKGKVKADPNTVFDAGDFILLLGDLSHITDAHVDEKIPGSKFNKGIDLKKAIVSLVSSNKPNQMTAGMGPNEKPVNDPEQAEKFKWLGLDCKTEVGVENVHKVGDQGSASKEEFDSMNQYTYKDSRGNEFKVKVKAGEGTKTTFLSFIGAKLGKIGDKIVLSVMTAFPGKNGAEIANRNDFMKQGYYFTSQSKEVVEHSTGTLAESKRVLGFRDWQDNVDCEDWKLHKLRRGMKPNSPDEQQHIGNQKWKYNKVTRKWDDINPDVVDDKIEAIEKMEDKKTSE